MKKEIFDTFFPEKIECINCECELVDKSKYWLCKDCLPEPNIKYCLRCGRSMQNEANYCLTCMEKTIHFTESRASVIFDDNAKSLIYKLKYGDGKYVASPVSAFMLDTFYSTDWDIDLVTYVPLHKKRERERGYNQSKLLAEIIAKNTDKPLVSLLKKVKYTKNLAKLDMKLRMQTILDSFKLNEKENIKQKRILLIDDVFTTGATVNECAKTLKFGKCSDIYILTFATSKIIPQTY